MKRLRIIGIAWMLLVGAFATTAHRVGAQGGAPEWQIGDFWRYSGQGFYRAQSYSAVLNVTVLEKMTVSLGSSSYESYRCNISGAEASADLTMNYEGDVYFRTGDLAIVKTVLATATSDWEFAYDPPLDNFQFPLTSGRPWGSIVQELRTGITYFYTFNVTGPEVANVESGAYNTFLVVGQARPVINVSKDYYSDAVGFLVKTRGLFLGPPRPFELGLQSYNYQKSSQSGQALILTVSIVVVAVAMIILLLFLRARRKDGSPPISRTQVKEGESQ